jgi:hypothetical protein
MAMPTMMSKLLAAPAGSYESKNEQPEEALGVTDD